VEIVAGDMTASISAKPALKIKSGCKAIEVARRLSCCLEAVDEHRVPR
jgi:hypothetical protein